jgi:hypothetical protein
MSVSIAEILRGAAVHAVPLTGECAGYLVLAAADQALTAPRQVDAAELHLLDDGSVRAVGTRACSEVDAERDLRQLLDRLLSSASSVTPALLRAGRRAPGAGMAPLLREIERALIPVNRSAARRALARLEREAARAVESGRLTEPPAPPILAATQPELAPPSDPVSLRDDAIAFEAPALLSAPAPALDLSPVPAVLPAVAQVPELPAARTLHELPPPPPYRAPLSSLPSLTPPPVAACVEERRRSLEVETRPEPVVARASARPPAAPSVAAPVVRSSTSATPSAPATATTPVLGTIVPRAEDAPTWRPPAGEFGLEVSFALDERTLFPEDGELIYAEEARHDVTERCPPALETLAPPALETLAPPALETLAPPAAALDAVPAEEPSRFTPVRQASAMFAVVPRRPEELVVLDQDEAATPMLTSLAPVAERVVQPAAEAAPAIAVEPVAELERLPAEPATRAEPEPEILDDIEILSESEVAPLVAVASPTLAPQPLAPPPFARPPLLPARHVRETPHPRLAMPKPRPSDVGELIGQLDSAPLPAAELRAELKSLAGLEPTPPPLGSDSAD